MRVRARARVAPGRLRVDAAGSVSGRAAEPSDGRMRGGRQQHWSRSIKSPNRAAHKSEVIGPGTDVRGARNGDRQQHWARSIPRIAPRISTRSSYRKTGVRRPRTRTGGLPKPPVECCCRPAPGDRPDKGTPVCDLTIRRLASEGVDDDERRATSACESATSDTRRAACAAKAKRSPRSSRTSRPVTPSAPRATVTRPNGSNPEPGYNARSPGCTRGDSSRPLAGNSPRCSARLTGSTAGSAGADVGRATPPRWKAPSRNGPCGPLGDSRRTRELTGATVHN